jgi:membrane protease YdiL (CAAX protease family)
VYYPPPPPPPPAETPPAPPPPGPAAPLGRYVAATVITVAAILSQYVVPEAVPGAAAIYGTLIGSFAIAYGIPLTAFALLVGVGPLRHAVRGSGRGLLEGLRWYGLLTLLALFLSLIALVVIIALQPSAANALSRPTPIVRAAQADPWLWVALSFVVGVVEETIFRGWIFGYWLTRSPGNWRIHAAWTSVLFASVHVYYALTYGIVFVVPAIVLVLDGLAFALAFRDSGGNLVGVSFVHGWNDATAFVALALPTLGLGLHYAVVLVGAILALVVYVRGRMRSPTEPLRPI